MKPELDKLQAIKDFPIAKTKKQVRSFLGIAGYYRCFIPNFASIEVPLTDLNKKSEPDRLLWTTKCNHAFEQLKQMLISTPEIWKPDFRRPFVLQTDASDLGVGAVLSQYDDEGHDHPVEYFS